MDDRSTSVRTPFQHLRLVDVEAAAPDLTEFGRAYWNIVGVDSETEEILWKSTVEELFLVYGMSYHDVDGMI